LVVAALVTLGACTPQLGLGDSPPPCLKGYLPCPMTGACQPVDPKKAMSPDALPLNCPDTLEIRQGDQVFLSAPGARIEDITVDGIPGDMLTATPQPDDQGRPSILIDAPHGTPAGDEFASKTRVFTITTKIGNEAPFVRRIPVIVSYITAAPWYMAPAPVTGIPPGDDKGPGIFSHPFATLQKAVSVAGPNDTILLRNPPNPAHVVQVGTGDDAKDAVTLPPGATLKCLDNDPVSLEMDVQFAGDATLENLRFDGKRLVISKPGSRVSFVNDILTHGLTVDAAASVAPGAFGTEVSITSATQMFDDRPPNAPAQSPLFVVASGAKILVDNCGIKMTDESAPVDALRLDGNGDTLTISGGTEITNAAGQPAVHVTGASSVTIMGAKFFADLLVENADTDVTAVNATFDRSALTFRGHDLKLLSNSLFTDYDKNFTHTPLAFMGHDLQVNDTTLDAHDLALPPGQDVVQIIAANDVSFENVTFKKAPVTFNGGSLVIKGATSFLDSLLTFAGVSLDATDAVFSGQGIQQLGATGSAASTSTAWLKNVTITNYMQWGYKLANGQLTISHGTFAHNPSVTASPDGQSAPWALKINADADTDSWVSSQATSYDGVNFMPDKCDTIDQMTCGVVGPQTYGAVYSISPGIKVSFSQ
jgi:hypothetical protein